MNKRFANGNQNLNRVNTKIDCWADQQAQFQQNNLSQQPRKQIKNYQSFKNQTNKFFNRSSGFVNNNNKYSEDFSEQYQSNSNMEMVYSNGQVYENNKVDMVATVPGFDAVKMSQESKPFNSFVPSVSVEHSINESLPSDDSMVVNGGQDNTDSATCSPSNSTNETNNEYEVSKSADSNRNYSNRNDFVLPNEDTNESYDQQQTLQNNIAVCNQMPQPQLIEVNEMCNKQTYNGNGMYPTVTYEYDYSSNMANGHSQIIPQQQAQQIYLYSPYPEYATVANNAAVVSVPNGSPSINGTPQQQTFYAYSPIQPYIYDPNMAYQNVMSAYSPVQNQQLQQPPTILSSPPQNQSNILNSYQTPPQTQHQLYLNPNNITPSTSTPPNDANCSSATIANERSSCNSPQISTEISSNIQLTQTPTTTATLSPNPYIVYQNSNPYMISPQYQSPIPAYMMFPPPIQSIQTIPTNVPLMTPPCSTNTNNRFNKNRSNRFNNNNSNYQKRNFNQRNNNFDQSPQCGVNMPYHPTAENIYAINSTPVTTAQQAPCFDESNHDEMNQAMLETNMSIYQPMNFCDNNQNMIGYPPMPATNETINYDQDGFASYGDEYVDNYEDGADDNDEQLACNICRGRRMCFCYFLKVRYYKFPSFFDLVDHQYKKWRSSMGKAKKA